MNKPIEAEGADESHFREATTDDFKNDLGEEVKGFDTFIAPKIEADKELLDLLVDCWTVTCHDCEIDGCSCFDIQKAKTAILAWRDKAIQNHLKFQEALRNGAKDE